MPEISHRRPTFSEAEAAEIVARLYGRSGHLIALPGERDQNFRLDTPDGEQFVLKIAGQTGSPQTLAMQNEIMTFVAAREETMCPQPVTAVSGQTITTFAANGHSYHVRLLTYLSGPLYAQAQPHDAHLQRSLGAFLGRLDKILSLFDHPAAHRRHQWNLAEAAFIRDYTQNITDPQDRALVEQILDQHETAIQPHLPQLRHQILHNDANDYNVIVRENEVAAIIDFGDAVYAPTICELAIGAAYALLHQPDPLLAAAQVIAGYDDVNPLTDEEIALLFPLMAARLAVSVTMSSTNSRQEPDNTYLQISAQPARQALRQLTAVDPQFAVQLLRHACGLEPTIDRGLSTAVPGRRSTVRTKEEIMALRQIHLGPSLSLSYREPLKIVRGYMQYLYDENGRAYLDAVNNVPHVGHCHPLVVRAGQQQMAILNTNTRYLHDLLAEYAQRLTALFPDPLNVIYFVCSGSEANELALRLARTATGRQDVLVLDGAYHGNTGELVNISPYKFNGPGGQGAPDYIHVLPMPDPYRGRYKGYTQATGQRYADHMRQTLAHLQERGTLPAAFIAEPMLGCGGQIVLPDGTLAAAYEYVRAGGGLCIADEVQVGFGRVGSHWWAFETQGVVPDIVTLGKPIGNGYPLAAVVTTAEIAQDFANGMEYFNTFGGNPVSCAVGLAVLDVIEQENLRQNALEVGQYLLAELRRLQAKHPLIGDVRGLGLYIGIELVRDRGTLEPAAAEATAVANEMKERGVLISTDGPLHNVLKIKPPLVFTRENANFFVETLSQILADLTKK